MFDQGNTYMKELPDLIKVAREERKRKLLEEQLARKKSKRGLSPDREKENRLQMVKSADNVKKAQHYFDEMK